MVDTNKTQHLTIQLKNIIDYFQEIKKRWQLEIDHNPQTIPLKSDLYQQIKCNSHLKRPWMYMENETSKLQDWSIHDLLHESSIHDAELVIQLSTSTSISKVTTKNEISCAIAHSSCSKGQYQVQRDTQSLILVRSTKHNNIIINMKTKQNNPYFPKFSTWPRQVEKQ